MEVGRTDILGKWIQGYDLSVFEQRTGYIHRAHTHTHTKYIYIYILRLISRVEVSYRGLGSSYRKKSLAESSAGPPNEKWIFICTFR